MPKRQSCFVLFLVSQILHRNILGIGRNQRPGLDRRAYEVGPRGGQSTGRRGQGGARAELWCGPLVGPPTLPFRLLKLSVAKTLLPRATIRKSSRDAAAVNPISGDSGDRLRHPAEEGNHHRRALHHHARLRIDV